MSKSLGNEAARAIKLTATDGSENAPVKVTATNGSDDDLWFTRPARQLLGSDPGLALHYLTGMPESTCYRAVRGDNWPSLPLYRKLLWGEQGETWLNVIMDGCNAEWWRERQNLSARVRSAEDLLMELGDKIARQLSRRGTGNGNLDAERVIAR